MSALVDPSGPCKRCQENEATIWWVGEGGSLALVHGFKQPWCERCCVEAQLRYVREAVVKLPELERQLASLGGPFAKEKP
jgi:hypothetical protein